MKLDNKQVVKALGALAQESRLAIFRLLVVRGPAGCAAGEIGAALKLPNATLSFHLKELSHAGLIASTQAGRFVYYAPDFDVMNGLLQFLTENCCGGSACGIDGKVCAPSTSASAKPAARKASKRAATAR